MIIFLFVFFLFFWFCDVVIVVDSIFHFSDCLCGWCSFGKIVVCGSDFFRWCNLELFLMKLTIIGLNHMEVEGFPISWQFWCFGLN